MSRNNRTEAQDDADVARIRVLKRRQKEADEGATALEGEWFYGQGAVSRNFATMFRTKSFQEFMSGIEAYNKVIRECVAEIKKLKDRLPPGRFLDTIDDGD